MVCGPGDDGGRRRPAIFDHPLPVRVRRVAVLLVLLADVQLQSPDVGEVPLAHLEEDAVRRPARLWRAGGWRLLGRPGLGPDRLPLDRLVRQLVDAVGGVEAGTSYLQ